MRNFDIKPDNLQLNYWKPVWMENMYRDKFHSCMIIKL